MHIPHVYVAVPTNYNRRHLDGPIEFCKAECRRSQGDFGCRGFSINDQNQCTLSNIYPRIMVSAGSEFTKNTSWDYHFMACAFTELDHRNGLWFAMMTSSNGNIFRITGSLWGESTGHRWIPLTIASDAELWCFLWSEPGQTVEKTNETLVIWYAIALIMTSQ